MQWKLMFLLMVCLSCRAEDEFHWRMADGRAAPQQENQKSRDGFGAWLLLTPDADWEQKWNTPNEHVPEFSVVKEVLRGEPVHVLPFYANPKVGPDGNIRVQCDFRLQRPDGTAAFAQQGLPCASGPLTMDPKTIFLTQQGMTISGDPDDQFGTWTVFIRMTDDIRQVSLDLQSSFQLVAKKTPASKTPQEQAKDTAEASLAKVVLGPVRNGETAHYTFEAVPLQVAGKNLGFIDAGLKVQPFGENNLVYLACSFSDEPGEPDAGCEEWRLYHKDTGTIQSLNSLPDFSAMHSLPALHWPFIGYVALKAGEKPEFACVTYHWQYRREVKRQPLQFDPILLATDMPGAFGKPQFSQDGSVLTCDVDLASP